MSDWSDSDSEILEITAIHGTQATTVKQEIEYDPEEDPHYGEIEEHAFITPIEAIQQESEINNHVLLEAIKNVSLVYTTRLEQMNAFKYNSNRLSSKEITEMILNESKPIYKQLQIKQEPNYESPVASYIQLCNKVMELNIKAKKEAKLKCEKLMEMCKPLKIVLEDICKKDRPSISKKRKINKPEFIFVNLDLKTPRNEDAEPSCLKKENLESYQETSNLSESESEVETSKSIGFESCPFISNNKPRETGITSIVIKHKKSQLADIFIVDAAKGMKSFYRINMSECSELQISHKSKQTLLLYYCCWVNMDKCINKLMQTGYYSYSTIRFLRKPHNCSIGQCKCCCFNEPLLPTTYSNVEFVKKPNKAFNTVIARGDVLIQRAMNYALKGPNILPKSIVPTSHLTCAVIIINYQGVIYQQTNSSGENYEIGNMGDIDIYEKPIVNRYLSDEIDCYRRKDKMLGIKRIYIGKTVCCWQKRDYILNDLHINQNIKLSTLRFMKTPHLCESVRCICCCCQGNITVMENITNLKNTLVYNKKRIVIKIPLKCDNEPLNPNLTVKQIIQSHDIVARKATIASNNLSPKSFPISNEIDLTDEELVRKNKGRKITSQRRTQGRRKLKEKETETLLNPTPTPTLTPAPAVPPLISTSTSKLIPPLTPRPILPMRIPTPTPNPIPTRLPNLQSTPRPMTAPTGFINGVLDKFKDLKLTVNEKGKLTAVINASPENLSTVEIKVLSDILTHAAAQIEQLGIAPIEFCNRVNSSRAANGFLSMSIPQLVGISTVVNQTAMNSNDVLNSNIGGNLCISVTKRNMYQLMSDLGGKKNINIVNSFNSYFGQRAKNKVSDTSVPKIISVYTLAGSESKSTEASAVKAVPKPVATNTSTVPPLTTIPKVRRHQPRTVYPIIPRRGLNQSTKFAQPVKAGVDGVLRYHTSDQTTSNLNQNIASIPGISVVASNSTEPAPVQNPMLFQMLAQESSNPPALAPLSLRPDPKQVRVTPLILAHSNNAPLGKMKRRRVNANNIRAPANKKSRRASPPKANANKPDIDIETTNVIQLIRRNKKTAKNETVNDKGSDLIVID